LGGPSVYLFRNGHGRGNNEIKQNKRALNRMSIAFVLKRQ
jgi:hypothetical protein